MPLTRDFRQTVQARARTDPAFRAGLYQGAIEALLNGEAEITRLLLRDLVNATAGFTTVASRINVTDKSLMRMLGPTGNPQLKRLTAILAALREEIGLNVSVEAAIPAEPASAPRPRSKAPARPTKSPLAKDLATKRKQNRKPASPPTSRRQSA